MPEIIDGKRVRKRIYPNRLPQEVVKKTKGIFSNKKKKKNGKRKKQIQVLENHMATGLSGQIIPKLKQSKKVGKLKDKKKRKRKSYNDSPELPEKHKGDNYYNPIIYIGRMYS